MGYRWTWVGLGAALILWISSVVFNLDVFEGFSYCLQQHEQMEFDELVFPLALFCFFFIIDLIRRRHLAELRMEKFKVYRSMVRAMNHILNNFLQKMLLFKLTADETEGFDQEVLKQYDTIIDEASAQIKALECLEHPDEKRILEAIVPDPEVN